MLTNLVNSKTLLSEFVRKSSSKSVLSDLSHQNTAAWKEDKLPQMATNGMSVLFFRMHSNLDQFIKLASCVHTLLWKIFYLQKILCVRNCETAWNSTELACLAAYLTAFPLSVQLLKFIDQVQSCKYQTANTLFIYLCYARWSECNCISCVFLIFNRKPPKS